MATFAFSSAGTTIALSAGAPTTFDATGYAALTYTVVQDVTDLGGIGPESSVITHAPLSENSVYKFKSTRNNGQLQLKGGRASGTEPGQALLQAAEASNDPYSIKITLQDGTVIYAQGLVMSYKTMIGGQGQITGFESNVEISGNIVTVAAP